MKNFSLSVLGYLLLLAINVSAQHSGDRNLAAIKADSLFISYSKTTSLVFPHAIKNVDRGSRDVLAQKAKGVENILQVKASQECFEETNLTVVTTDGKLYAFIVRYEPEPQMVAIAVNQPEYNDPEIAFSPGGFDEGKIADYSRKALISREKNIRSKDHNYGITVRLNGLFIEDNVMYLRFYIKNTSTISFDPDQLRFLIRDKKKAKRTSSQEIELRPLAKYNFLATIPSHEETTFVIALPKFTIPDKKYLAIQLAEGGGGRHYELKVSNKKLMKPARLGPL